MNQPRLELADREPGSSVFHLKPETGTPWSVLAWAVWLGLLAGSLELFALILKCNYLDPRNYNVSRHFPWMYPVSGVLILIGPGLVLAVAVWAKPRWLSKPAAVGILSFFAFLSVLFRAPIYTVACLALAAGGAFQLARLIRARPRGADRLVRWTLGPLVGLLVATVAVTYGRSTWLERQALATRPASSPMQPQASKSKSKNVVLIVLDTVRAQSLSLYGYGRKTSPNLERIAAEGVCFDQALATAPWTAPSHAGMFTGRWPHQLSIGWSRPLDRTHPTLAEFLGARGYHTAGFVANTTYCSYETGLDRGFSHYEDYDVSVPNIILCSGLMQRTLNFVRNSTGLGLDDLKLGGSPRKDAARINRDFLGWLASRSDQASPYFAFLNYFDAHHPYLTPEPQARQARSPADASLLRTWWDRDKRDLAATDLEMVRDSYDHCLTYLDDQIGRLFKELTRRGELDDTIVIVTADHGEHLGEKRLYGHGCSLYRPELHVPLLVFAPGAVPQGQVIKAPVSLRDLPATVVDLLGLANESPFPGRSLAAGWSGDGGGSGDPSATPLADSLLSEIDLPPELDPNGGRSPVCRGPMLSLVADGWHYIRNGDGREELYDFNRDPAEAHDLAASADKTALIRSLRTRAGVPAGSEAERLSEAFVPKSPEPPAQVASQRSVTATKGF